jgi:hypothetical protein
MSAKKLIIIAMITVLCFSGGISRADDTDEAALFTSSLTPDALIVLDLSGSMNMSPNGDVRYTHNLASGGNPYPSICTSSAYGCSGGYCLTVDLDGDGYVDAAAPCTARVFFPWGADSSCTANTTACSGTNCINGFCATSQTGCATDCSRLAIAKKAIFNILDDDGDNIIRSADETSLGVRIGYMRFYNATSADIDGSYTSGSNKLMKAIGIRYSNLFCGSNASCAYDIPYYAPSNSCSASNVRNECAWGGTPLAASLSEAKAYLDVHKTDDGLAGACRQKFAVLISDGADTYACAGTGTETQSDMYKRRRESVAKAKALADAGYRVFVIGFGSDMPANVRNTLNWMAYYGGTDNPLQANTGNPSAYDPSAVTISCQASSTTGICDGSSRECYATENDPGNTPLSGYAFIAANADEISSQLKMAFNIIREANYSFSQASVQLNRTVDENFIYEGSVQPIANDPFWFGHLRKYAINDDGSRGAELWNAGQMLMTTDASVRNIKTYIAGSMTPFTTAIDRSYFAVSTDAIRNMVVGFFRGESAYNIENWKLGDIFRSKPITVGTPSFFFEDVRDTQNAFAAFRSTHLRDSSPYTGRVVLVGANDGQLHAFKTSDGSEAWSFVPPSLLSRLKLIAHNTHPTNLSHQSYVDGPVTVADAWVPDSASSGTFKYVADWRTHVIFGLGQGAGENLWSSSTHCDSGFSQKYTSSYPYYCGYYCLDVTDPLNSDGTSREPYLCGYRQSTSWIRFTVDAAAAPYLGAPWSTPMVGRVKVGGNEKWVAIIGGGYSSPGAANSGKGLFVFDLANGSLLWSYTKANNSNLNSAMPAPPAIADTDSDGFIDTVYLGDISNNMWRFKFCRATDSSSCGTADWTGGLFFASTPASLRPIYTAATVAKDNYNNTWVYWGTGDKTDPTAPNAQEKLYALKDTDFTSTWNLNNMQNITAEGSTYSGTAQGWYINLTGGGEKMLAEPTVFGGVVYFTTFKPPSGNDPCAQGGTATLFGVNYTTGGGSLNLGGEAPVRSMVIGVGIPSAPVVSLRPGNDPTPDLYVTTSGGGGISAETARVNMDPRGLANRTNIIFWRDTRIE